MIKDAMNTPCVEYEYEYEVMNMISMVHTGMVPMLAPILT